MTVGAGAPRPTLATTRSAVRVRHRSVEREARRSPGPPDNSMAQAERQRVARSGVRQRATAGANLMELGAGASREFPAVAD